MMRCNRHALSGLIIVHRGRAHVSVAIGHLGCLTDLLERGGSQVGAASTYIADTAVPRSWARDHLSLWGMLPLV
jgi:hypothetical protein